jgi:hypothetical protein
MEGDKMKSKFPDSSALKYRNKIFLKYNKEFRINFKKKKTHILVFKSEFTFISLHL